MSNGYRLLNIVASQLLIKEKILLTPLRSVPRCAFLPSVVRSFNKGYTENASARHFPKFCSVSLRKTSYIPNVSWK